MPTSLRAIIATVLLAVLFGALFLGAWTPADAKLWELRFSAADRKPSEDVVFVDIDAASLAEIGTWPWPRSLHGQLLDQLMAMGAYEVAFDIDFSTRSVPTEDAAFAASLERAGGYAYLAAFRQAGPQGTDIWNHPIAQFRALAQPALVNVDSLEAGMAWSLPGKNLDQELQAIAGHFNPGKPIPETVHIDYSIDLDRIVRIPASTILNGSADQDLIRDRQIVIGASAIELHDLLIVPRFGIVPGPIVQIAAVESLRQDRALTDLGNWPAGGLSLIFVVASLVLPRLKLGPAFALAVGASAILEAGTMALYASEALQLDTTLFHATVAGVLLIRLLEERAVRRRQLRAQHARLLYLANHDEQTGALTHLAWCDAVGGLVKQDGEMQVLLLRVEQLEDAGASLGFRVTDEVIIKIYNRLMMQCREPVGRIETNVFALALAASFNETDRHQLLRLIEAPYEVAGHQVLLRLRWGTSICVQGGSASTSLQEARTALAMAVRRDLQGCVYSSAFDLELERRRQLDLSLRRAVAKQELDLAFQLQVDTRTRRATGVEALLRWNSEDHGQVSPAEFIPLAEEAGTIVELGSWVAHEACRRAVESGWQGRMSINVSPVQVQTSDVVGMVRSALNKSGFPADRLDVEITESLVAGGEKSIIGTLSALRELGVCIAIDDFGTGFSSLSHLAILPIDKLKIDQSFVRQIKASRGADLIRSMAELGNRLDLSIVVEGVETEEEFNLVANLHCEAVQGFLFGRPGPLPLDLFDVPEAAA